MKERNLEIDYLKGILILLVIAFHLVWFEQLHPFAKQVVYSFHMPGFLLISGYLMNICKEPRDFLRTLLWLAVPYIIMESGYIFMASLLPINEHIDHLTPWVFLDRLLLHPLGPYWYLHALILCGATYYIIIYLVEARGKKQENTFCPDNSLVPCPMPLAPIGRVILTGFAYYVLSHVLGILSFSSALYFLAGAILRRSGTDFAIFFRPSRLSIFLFALLVFFSEKPTQASLNGALIAYFAISSLLTIYRRLPPAHRPLLLFFGRNSLVLYVFSPVFTILCKRLVPYLQFDPTGLIFLAVSLAVCVAGSLAIAWAMDKTRLSRFFFGRKAIRE